MVIVITSILAHFDDKFVINDNIHTNRYKHTVYSKCHLSAWPVPCFHIDKVRWWAEYLLHSNTFAQKNLSSPPTVHTLYHFLNFQEMSKKSFWAANWYVHTKYQDFVDIHCRWNFTGNVILREYFCIWPKYKWFVILYIQI